MSGSRPTLDPRLQGRGSNHQVSQTNQQKRQASRSPEGSAPKIKPRIDPNMQYVDSPDSIGSRRSQYEDTTSGQSTPMSTNGTPNYQQIVPAAAPMNGTHDAGSSFEFNSIVKLIMDLQVTTTEVTILEFTKKQAESKKKRADLESDSMSKHFQQYPAMDEKHRTESALADRELATTQQALNEKITTQRTLAKDFSKLFQARFSRAAVTSNSTNQSGASEELKQIQSRITNLEKQVAKTADTEKQIKAEMGRYKTVPSDIAKLEQRVSSLELSVRGNNEDLTSAVDKSSSLQKKVHKLQHRTDKLDQQMAGAAATTSSNDHGRLRDVNDRLSALEEYRRTTDEASAEKDQAVVDYVVHVVDGKLGQYQSNMNALDEKINFAAAKHDVDASFERYTNFLEEISGKISKLENWNAEIETAKGMLHGADAKLSEMREHLDRKLAHVDRTFAEMRKEMEKAVTKEAVESTFASFGEELDKKLDRASAEKLSHELHALKEAFNNANASLVSHGTTPAATAMQPSTGQAMDALNNLMPPPARTNLNGITNSTKLQGECSVPAHGPAQTPAQQNTNSVSNSMPPPPPPRATNADGFVPLMPQDYREEDLAPPPGDYLLGPGSKYILANNMHPEVRDAFAEVLQWIECNSEVLMGLTTRFDNLTTDDLAKCMMDQLADMWPYAKHYEHYCRDFDNRIRATQTSLQDLQKQIRNVQSHAASAKTMSSDTKSEVGKLVEKVEKELKVVKAMGLEIGSRMGEYEARMQQFEKSAFDQAPNDHGGGH